jgi:hypothetical protein
VRPHAHVSKLGIGRLDVSEGAGHSLLLERRFCRRDLLAFVFRPFQGV